MNRSQRHLLIIAITCAWLLGSGQTLFAQGWCVQPVPTCDPSDPKTSCYKPPPPDPRCEPRECNKCTKSPCFVGSGAYTTGATDLHLPTPGFPLVAARRYESTQAIDSPTGYGWTSSFAARLYYATYLLAAPDVVKREANVTMPTGDRYRFVENADGTFSPPLGRYDTLRRNADGSFDLTLQRSMSVLHFDSSGSLRRMADDYGNELLYGYDGSGRLERVADAAGSGRYIDVHWGADGRISSLVDSAGRQVGYRYDGRGVLIEVSDPLGRLTNYTYGSGKYVPVLAAVRDNWGRVVSDITYDAQDRVTSYSENGATYTYTFNYQGNPAKTAKRDEAGNTWVFTHGSGGLVTSDVVPANGGTRNASYYGDGSIQQRTDELGIKTLYTYDSSGRVSSETRDYQGPNETKFRFTYDPGFPMKITSVTAVNGSTNAVDTGWQGQIFEYYQPGSIAPGALHRIFLVQTDGVTRDTVATFAYDSRGRVISATDGDGGVTEYMYDAKGNLARVVLPANNDGGIRPVLEYEYDETGRIIAAKDAEGRQTTFEFDAVDRLVALVKPSPSPSFPGTFSISVEHDQFDPETGLTFEVTTDPNGRSTRRGFDAFGRLMREADAAGGITRYLYRDRRLVEVVDAGGNRTTYGYDPHGRRTSTVAPDGLGETYSYYNNGLMRSYTDRRGQTFNYSYDRLGRLSVETYPNSATMRYFYSGEMLTRVVDATVEPAEAHDFSYDASYRIATESQGGRATVEYSYTQGGRRASDRIVGGPERLYTYYPDGQLNTIHWSEAVGNFKYSYTPTGLVNVIVFPNGQRREFTYDGLSRLTQVANLHPGQGNLATFRYIYDMDVASGLYTAKGHKTGMIADIPALGMAGALTKYSYDERYQLKRVEYPSQPPFGGEVASWTYDNLGNRLTETVNSATRSYSYQSVGGAVWNRLISDGIQQYEYDNNGNTTAILGPDSSLGLQWNSNGRLDSLSGRAVAQYAYDYQGRRTKKENGATTSYIYDGQSMMGERSAIGDVDYVMGQGLDEPLAMNRESEIYYYSIDGLGSVVLVGREDGSVANSYVYDAWGKTRAADVATPNPFGFTAREIDEAGLMHFRYRQLAPDLGRFLSEDPLGVVTDTNLYRYVRNSPLAFIDPLGLECSTKSWYGSWRVMDSSMGDVWLPIGYSDPDTPEPSEPGYPAPWVPKPRWARRPPSSGGARFGGVPWVIVDCIWQRWLEVSTFACRAVMTITVCPCQERQVSHSWDCETRTKRYGPYETVNEGRIASSGHVECPPKRSTP